MEWADPATAPPELPERAADLEATIPEVASWALPAAAGLTGFGVYWATLAPTISTLDSPELSAAAITLGVPHPTGYPLFILVAHAWQALLGVFAATDPAWRLNLLTAAFAGTAVACVAAAGHRLTGRASAGWLAAGVFGFSPAFWAQANVVEVYSLHIAFCAAILVCWLHFEDAAQSGGDLRVPLRVLALMVGLSFTHHLMTVLVLPILGVSLAAHLRKWWSPREAVVLTALGLAPLAAYAALPFIAATDPLVNWGNPQTLGALWYHVSGGQYHSNVAVPTSTIGTGTALAKQFGWVLLPLALLGCFQTGATTVIRAALAAGFAAAAVFGLSYGVLDSEPFHLNAYLIMALWMAGGASFAIEWTRENAPAFERAAGLLVWLAPGLALVSNFAEQDRRYEFTPHDHAIATLAMLPRDAVLVTQGPAGYPPVYAQLVENLRPDVAVVDTYLHVRGSYGPELDRLRQSRLPDHITREMALFETVSALAGGTRSLWLMPGVPDFEFDSWGLQRVRGGLVDPLLRRPPDLRATPPSDFEFEAGDFGRGFSLRGVQTDLARVESGSALRVAAWWQLGSPRELTVAYVLADADGSAPTGPGGLPLVEQKRPLGGGVPLASYASGEIIREESALLVPRSLAPGEWWLWVALRDGEDWFELPDGRLFARAAKVEVTPRKRGLWELPRSDPGERRR